MGCKIAGAAQIVVIDLCREKFEAAKKLGATDFVNPKDIPEGKSLPEYLVETFDGGFDYTFECIGNVDTTQQALESSHIGWGVTCIVGVAPKDRPLVTSPMLFITGRTLTGCAYGGWRCRDDIPKMIADYLSGKLNLKEFVSHRLELKDINKALELLHSGQSLRTIMKVAGD
jgi:S-(hydroxymethyl)glutathione dehydrogenase/alcohol dehydrogenase